VLFGIVHVGDDYYYGMRSRESQLMRLLSCVGSLTQGHGFTEAHMMTVSNRPVLSPEQVADMAIYAEAMRLVSGEGEHLIINGEALNEFMQRSPKHARYARDLIGKPKDWKARDDYFDQMGWEYADVPPEAT
jgi:hypothetical protein